MKIALVGTGRMGRAVEALALERGHGVVARFNTQYPLAAAEDVSVLHGADVVIDFSLPALALENYRLPSAFNPISTSRRTASERLGLLCHCPMAGCTVGA